MANLVVGEGDLEENWQSIISENAYIIDPALQELNETFNSDAE